MIDTKEPPEPEKWWLQWKAAGCPIISGSWVRLNKFGIDSIHKNHPQLPVERYRGFVDRIAGRNAFVLRMDQQELGCRDMVPMSMLEHA